MGPVLAADIIAETGDVNKYHGQAALAKVAGLFWSRHQSCAFDAEETSLTKSKNIYLRYYPLEAANRGRMHTPQYRRYYQKKVREVPKHQHKRALVLTARKLMRLVYALLSTGQIYRHQGGHRRQLLVHYPVKDLSNRLLSDSDCHRHGFPMPASSLSP